MGDLSPDEGGEVFRELAAIEVEEGRGGTGTGGADLEERDRRDRWWVAFLLIGTLVSGVGGFILLFFSRFIGTLIKEVF